MAAKQFYMLPNGMRVLATPSQFARLSEHAQKQPEPPKHDEDDDVITHLLMAHAS
jgi:hypothetical protein